MSYNSVTLIGNLGDDPEMRYTPAGKSVTNLRLAVNEYYRDAAGDRHNMAHWFSVECWEKTAELAIQHLSKGSRVLVDGRLKTRSYTDRQGVKRYAVDVVATRLVFLDAAPARAGDLEPDRELAGVGADLEDLPF